jgi:short-subunit dehydrogenase
MGLMNGNGRGRKLLAGAAIGAVLLGTQLRKRRQAADLRGNVALITGGTTGLGYLMAREFGHEGCKLVICARDEDELRAARDELAREGFDVLAIPCDVSQSEQVEELVHRALTHFGRIDILVNNAGVIQVGPLETIELSDFRNAMDTMYWGTVHPTLSVLPHMRSRGSGRIVNITSIGGKISVPHMLPYNSAKFAATGFSEGLRSELESDGITVTTIVPGLMRTGSFKNALVKGKQEQEYLWFSLGSSLPIVSMDAERAAQQILDATRRGESERILSIPANVIAKLHGVFPGTTQRLLGLVDWLILPDADGTGSRTTEGRDVEERIASRAFETATTMGQSAAERFQHEESRQDRE